MASLVYSKFIQNVFNGTISQVDFDTNTFKMLLVTSSYTPDRDAHDFRNDITNEVANGNGYTTGGATFGAITVTLDTTNDRIDITFPTISWASATFTARAGVIYKDAGGAASDPLIAYVDFGTDVTATAGTFTVTFSGPLRFSNAA